MAKNSRDAYGASGEQKVLLIAPENLTVVTDEQHPLYDPRVDLPVDEALVQSIMVSGIIEPILVVKSPEDGKILVVLGRQRVKATLEANKRLKKSGSEPILVPCQMRRGFGDGTELFGLSVTENELRQADTPLGRAQKMKRLLDRGRSEAQVAVTFGCSVATVKNLLGILDATAAVRKAVDKGEVSASEAYKLAKLEPEEQRKKVEKLKTEAPRTERKKRTKGAKKRREILDGPTKGRTPAEVLKMQEQIAESEEVSGEYKRIVDVVFRWMLGEDAGVLAEITMNKSAVGE